MKFLEYPQTLSLFSYFLSIKTLKEQESIISRPRFFTGNLQTLHVIHFIVREGHQDFTIPKDNRQKSYFINPNGSLRDRCMPLFIRVRTSSI